MPIRLVTVDSFGPEDGNDMLSPDVWEEYEREEEEIAQHKRKCKVDGFCYVCQCL